MFNELGLMCMLIYFHTTYTKLNCTLGCKHDTKGTIIFKAKYNFVAISDEIPVIYNRQTLALVLVL